MTFSETTAEPDPPTGGAIHGRVQDDEKVRFTQNDKNTNPTKKSLYL